MDQLLAARANINHLNGVGRTQLSLAAEGGHGRSVRQLLEAKDDVDISAQMGCPALLLTAFRGNSAIMTQPIKAGADVHNANISDTTPLMDAVLLECHHCL
jgi:ankyrin repeat protein